MTQVLTWIDIAGQGIAADDCGSLIVQYLEKKLLPEPEGGKTPEGEGCAGVEEKGSKEAGKTEGAMGADAGEKKKE
jgi:hypothetical protein